MVTGKYSDHSIRNYLSELRYFFAYYVDERPSRITQDQSNMYLLYLGNVQKSSSVKIKMAAQAIGFFYNNIRKERFVTPSYLFKAHVQKLPPYMTVEEVKKVIESIKNAKHRMVISLIYSTGVRISEALNIKLVDILGKEKRIKIIAGKGNKDRFVHLSERLLIDLRQYYITYQPKHFLFEGQIAAQPYSVRSVQKVFNNALLNCGLDNKNYRVHTLRHSYATHLVEQGVDIHTIKELLGHQNLKQTMLYLHLSKARFKDMQNPYDGLFDDTTDDTTE